MHGEVEVGQGGLDDVFFDEGARGSEAAVEIEGGDDSFEGVGQERGFFAASALLFTAAEEEERAEVDAFCDLAETYPWQETRAGYFGSDIHIRKEPVGVCAQIIPSRKTKVSTPSSTRLSGESAAHSSNNISSAKTWL